MSQSNALEVLADQLERDRREPDKVLCYVLDLRRMALTYHLIPADAKEGISVSAVDDE